MTTAIDRITPVEAPVLDIIAERWSPRAFDETAPIDEAKLASALEAARWAPSAFNGQPWRFLVAHSGSELHARIMETLTSFNQGSAPRASVLIVALAEASLADGTPLTHSWYDLGQSVALLSAQAQSDGLLVHQMSGFDAAEVAAFPEVPARFAPVTVIAIGELGDAATLPEKLREREGAPRVRRPIGESVLTIS